MKAMSGKHYRTWLVIAAAVILCVIAVAELHAVLHEHDEHESEQCGLCALVLGDVLCATATVFFLLVAYGMRQLPVGDLLPLEPRFGLWRERAPPLLSS